MIAATAALVIQYFMGLLPYFEVRVRLFRGKKRFAETNQRQFANDGTSNMFPTNMFRVSRDLLRESLATSHPRLKERLPAVSCPA